VLLGIIHSRYNINADCYCTYSFLKESDDFSAVGILILTAMIILPTPTQTNCPCAKSSQVGASQVDLQLEAHIFFIFLKNFSGGLCLGCRG
jgi:hypothetical protein